MFRNLLEKELKVIILSPKFTATFLVCSTLIVLSVFVGIKDYQAATRQYEAAVQLADQQMREGSSWMGLTNRTYRKPDPMQIIVAGINNDVGRYSVINSVESVKLTNSVYSDDPIFAVFRYIDLTFIFQVVLSLFAILFTFDAINGERESGMLQLTFSNAVPRVQYLLAKFIGSLLALFVPLLIPLLLTVLLLLVYKVPFNGEDWTRIGTWLLLSLLFFTCFVSFGLFVSTLVRRSAVSFLICLVSWVLFVLIIPRTSIMAAGQMVSVPSVGEIEGQQDGFAKQRWQKYTEALSDLWRSRSAQMEGLSGYEREAYRDDHMWDWMQEDDKSRKAVRIDIDEFSRKLREDVRNRREVRERLGLSLSRFSPASAYQLAAMNLSGTNLALKSRYEDAMDSYRDNFNGFVEKKREESGGSGGIRVTVSSEAGLKISTDRERGTLDLTEMPRFEAPKEPFFAALGPSIPDFGLLAIYSIVGFLGAFIGFLRYDLR